MIIIFIYLIPDQDAKFNFVWVKLCDLKKQTSSQEQNGILTFIAVPDGVKVHVVLVISEEEEAEPGIEGVDRNDEEDPDDVALLPGRAVEPQVHVDLEQIEKT